MTTLNNAAALLGRILIAAIFLWAGTGKIAGFEGTVARITAAGLPMAHVFAIITIAFEIGAAVLLILGFGTRIVALALAGFCLATAVLFHNYWAAAPAQAINQQVHFMKNIAMVGGLLFVFVTGAGKLSIDGLRGRA